MGEDEFWIEPCEADGHVAVVHASFNEFAVTIRVERQDGGPISEQEAERAYTSVMKRVPRRVRFNSRRQDASPLNF